MEGRGFPLKDYAFLAVGLGLLLNSELYLRVGPDCKQNMPPTSGSTWYWEGKSMASNTHPWMCCDKNYLEIHHSHIHGPAGIYTLMLGFIHQYPITGTGDIVQ